MKKEAIVRMIELFDGIIYHNFTWSYFGFSGGIKMYGDISDFIPDAIIHLHCLENN